MKVYTKIVIDMETYEVIEVEYFNYSGPVAECKGGSTTTTSVDYAYNARMAAIAERQQQMAEEYFEFWQTDYKPLERAQIQANIGLIPYQAAHEQMSLESEMELMPMQTEFGKEQLTTGIQQQQELRPVMSEYYKQALEGVDSEERVQQARADVGVAFKEEEEAMVREATRLGLNPNDPRFQKMMGTRGLGQAKATAGAMTTARTQAEEESFQRLSGAMNFGLPG